METFISIVGSICGSITGIATENAVGPITRQLSYLFKHRTKFQNLRNKVQELKAAGERVEQSVREAKMNGEVIFPDVETWLTVVNEKISDQAATQLEEDEEKFKRRCFAGCCPDLKLRYQHSKKAQTEADTIAQLLNEKDQFINRVSYRPSVQAIGINRPVKDYASFESRTGAFNGVMAALKDDNVNKVGIYGMGGVGKTTLVKEIAIQAQEKLSFTAVVFVAVTQAPNMQDIQNKIAEKLNLKIDETDMDVRATRLRQRLKTEKKVFIILDDIWVTLNLEALGVPVADEHNECKILMTSRSLDVLKSMDAPQNLSIETLNEDEAQNLFKNIAGNIVERPDLQSIAVAIAKRCAGLPIAIATIAKALKHKQNLFEWRDALRQLNKPSKGNFKGIPAEAYSAIELSYKFLDEKVQPIFLLCSIMGHDVTIEDLLRYARGLGLFNDVKGMEETRDKVLTLVTNLKASCLLLDGSNPTRFDMHDVVCDVALSIALSDCGWFTPGEEDVFEILSDKDTMRDCNLVSLRNAKVSELPNELDCPNLTFFSMHGALEIPNNFFKGMQRLKVLNFVDMHFTSLPSSLGSLKTLSSLCLRDCGLKDIIILGELKHLEILDLRKSKIKILPKEIGQLTMLKLLDLSDCRSLEVTSPGVLSNLSRLEELYLYNSFDRWEVQGTENPRSNASLVELQHLSRLTTLEVHIPDVQAMPKDNIFSAKLERYKISIGDGKWFLYGDRGMEVPRMLKLKMKTSVNLFHGIKRLLRTTQSLYLAEVKDVREILYDPITQGFPDLKHLSIFDVSDIKVVINSMMSVPCLELLSLWNLTDLEAIFDDQLKAASFDRLRIIRVWNGKKLNNLFSFSMATELHQLEQIYVSNCDYMIGLIVVKEETGDDEILEFRQLSSLYLKDLSSFKSLWYSEETLESVPCLFDKKVILPVLEELSIEDMDNLERLWPNQLSQHSFSKLTSIQLRRCPKLLDVFPSSMLTRFQRLNQLSIRNCKSVEEIVFESHPQEESRAMQSFSPQLIQSDVIISEFPCLTSLVLGGLPNLRSIHREMLTINWPSLKEMEVEGCDKVEILFASQETTGFPVQQPLFWVNQSTFPKLHQLTLGGNAGMKETWYSDGQQLVFHHFPNLEVVKLEEYTDQALPLPSYLFTLLSSPNLQTLEIRRCSFQEIMFQSEEGGEEKSAWVRKFNLVPSSVSFRNLVTLRVELCHGIIKLITHSTAKSLVQLREMRISDCQDIEEIIQGADDDDEIHFPQLNHLELTGLPKLESFCSSRNHTFEFPSLQTVIVIDCQKMKVFAGGHSNTPMLHKVRLHWWREEEPCEGSLNSTIQQLFREKKIMIGLCYMAFAFSLIVAAGRNDRRRRG
ncbi:hypothetical protein V6N11_047925 [Hibiscus sabdariffa]|uniref:Uncharacterized protein n=2 Tax=Hibiscus sabdariffa TaxID=183260 RepID=A0ABR2NXF5_9ROSI